MLTQNLVHLAEPPGAVDPEVPRGELPARRPEPLHVLIVDEADCSAQHGRELVLARCTARRREHRQRSVKSSRGRSAQAPGRHAPTAVWRQPPHARRTVRLRPANRETCRARPLRRDPGPSDRTYWGGRRGWLVYGRGRSIGRSRRARHRCRDRGSYAACELDKIHYALFRVSAE
jgi:hypothetical protein